jgi:hypothetical protein
MKIQFKMSNAPRPQQAVTDDQCAQTEFNELAFTQTAADAIAHLMNTDTAVRERVTITC